MTRRALDYLHDVNEELNYMFFLSLIKAEGDDINFEVVSPSGRHITWWGSMKTPADSMAWQILDNENEKTPATD